VIPVRRWWALLAATVWLAGCGLLPGMRSGPGFQGGGSCSELPGGACQEQMDLAARRHPDAVELDLACTAPSCTRAGGAGTVVVTLRNGSKLTEAFTYVGDPAPMPAPTCTGLPADVCRRVATSTVDELPPSKRIASIRITCTSGPCTRDRGETAVEVQYADGTGFQTHSGWEGGPP
jgi:hypothetical protein